MLKNGEFLDIESAPVGYVCICIFIIYLVYVPIVFPIEQHDSYSIVHIR